MLEAIKRDRVPWKRFIKDLKTEISEDNVANGAAALAYYLTLAIFPAMLVLLSIVPYLPIQNLDQEVMNLLRGAMPGDAATMFTGVVTEITNNKKGGLLSVGLLGAIWAASNGMYAIMQQLNITYDVKEHRSFLKTRGTALLLMLLFGVLIIGAFSLVIFGGKIEEWLTGAIGMGGALKVTFNVFRWMTIALALTLGFALIYYFGPDVDQEFKFITPGSVFGALLLVGASLGFKVYVENFGQYSATYGSIGAVIIFELWLYVTGFVLLLGSEINALVEHYSAEGKEKGERGPGQKAPDDETNRKHLPEKPRAA